MEQDVLSDLLRRVRLRGAVFYHVNCRDPWSAIAPPASEIAEAVMPGAEHVIEYHMLARGSGWAAVQGETPVRIHCGDIVMFPHGDSHVMSSAPGVKPSQSDPGWVFSVRNQPKPIPVAYHDGVVYTGVAANMAHVDTVLVCGFLSCDLRPFNPLIGAMPRLLHLPAARVGSWVERVIEQAVQESSLQRPGREAVLQRLSEMMFVDGLRCHIEHLPETSGGWLAGLRDRFVGRALALLHQSPEYGWTIDELGRKVGLSRSALHERFVAMLGQPPMQYLTHWRMQLAVGHLRDTQATVADVALQVGYDSEAAFSRAFKRIVGTSPAAWRREKVVN